MIRALFVSGLARNRAPTAAQAFEGWQGVRTDFAGLSAGTDSPLAPDQIDWAHRIYVFEKRQKAALSARFSRRLRGRAILDLDIPDLYTFMQPELVDLLTERVGPELRAAARG
ncbi:MAG: phosphotyrosine protein phosphatase [Pseudomonadota bacterium]|nr:phosphotyrosine protein phosphatase [Pseudomonadota bacterium]MEE3098985.1 phosphotyrosine protein phosphatase [Pseudomonadota bacterium]